MMSGQFCTLAMFIVGDGGYNTRCAGYLWKLRCKKRSCQENEGCNFVFKTVSENWEFLPPSSCSFVSAVNLQLLHQLARLNQNQLITSIARDIEYQKMHCKNPEVRMMSFHRDHFLPGGNLGCFAFLK